VLASVLGLAPEAIADLAANGTIGTIAS
jgi:hypothetical protein